MTRTNLTFSFHKVSFREGSRVPTFTLPGIVRGTIHVAQSYEERFDVVKIVLKGLLIWLPEDGFIADKTRR